MKRNILCRSLLLIPVAGFFLNGCGGAEQFKKNYQEATEAYYAPESLGENPQGTGLLLVDAVTKKALNTMPLTGVMVVNVKEPDKKIVLGSFKTGGFLSQVSGVVVIPELRPGTYRIVKINTSNANMWETLYMPLTREFEVEVKPGRPIYFGQIQVRHPMGSTDRVITVNYDKSREVSSWEMVLDKYKGSAWEGIITEHVKKLR